MEMDERLSSTDVARSLYTLMPMMNDTGFNDLLHILNVFNCLNIKQCMTLTVTNTAVPRLGEIAGMA